MKRICITTSFGTNNYGSNLQAIGLSETLKKKGYKVFFLQKFSVMSFMIRHPILLWARISNRINRKRSVSFFQPDLYEISAERKKRIEDFNKDNFETLSITNARNWQKIINEQMIFISGSDIIWNPARGYPTKYFLDFAYYAGLKRFSYASSIGELSLPPKYYKAYQRYIGTMDAVGVREQSVINLLNPIIGNKAVQVIDPSLLLNQTEWDKYSDKAKISLDISPYQYVFCYFVMEDVRYWKYVEKIKSATELKIVVLPMHYSDEKQPYDIVYDGTAYEFIWLIKNAAFICTDSFHACAFSLQYQKEFYLLKRSRKSEDAKYDDFLSRYHLLGRRIENEDYFIRNHEIDYRKSIKQLEDDRAFANLFLQKALEG